MKEARFNTEVVKSLRHWGAWAYKMADMPHFAGARFRFDQAKPCDIVAGYQGKLIAIESKQKKKYEAFGIRQMQPGQIKALDEISAAGCEAWIFLNIRIAKPRTNKLLIFPWATWRQAWEKESIKADELRAMPGIEGVKGLFDLRNFLNMQ